MVQREGLPRRDTERDSWQRPPRRVVRRTAERGRSSSPPEGMNFKQAAASAAVEANSSINRKAYTFRLHGALDGKLVAMFLCAESRPCTTKALTGGGGDFAAGLFRRGIFRISNPCEISQLIFRSLCEINPLRNLAKCVVQQLPEHKSVVPFHKS